MSAVANDKQIIIIMPSVQRLSCSFCRPIITEKMSKSSMNRQSCIPTSLGCSHAISIGNTAASFSDQSP